MHREEARTPKAAFDEVKSVEHYDDIFKSDESRNSEEIKPIPLSELKPFEEQPFKVLLDESMDELVESIQQNGVLSPIIARPHKVPVGKLCKTQHRIKESVVLTLISDMLKEIAEYANTDKEEFVKIVQEAQANQQQEDIKKSRTRLAVIKQRLSELEKLCCKIYEDNALGKLPDERYLMLDGQYAKEQKSLSEEMRRLENTLKDFDNNTKSTDKFIALINKYQNFDNLTIAMLNEFVEKILVHERARKGSADTTQEIEIYFNFIGKFVPPSIAEYEPTPEEIEEQRKKEERRERLHQNYLRRKANGKQKEYDERAKAKRKAAMDAKKNAIRAEDIASGVFIPVGSLPKQEPTVATAV